MELLFMYGILYFSSFGVNIITVKSINNDIMQSGYKFKLSSIIDATKLLYKDDGTISKVMNIIFPIIPAVVLNINYHLGKRETIKEYYEAHLLNKMSDEEKNEFNKKHAKKVIKVTRKKTKKLNRLLSKTKIKTKRVLKKVDRIKKQRQIDDKKNKELWKEICRNENVENNKTNNTHVVARKLTGKNCMGEKFSIVYRTYPDGSIDILKKEGYVNDLEYKELENIIINSEITNKTNQENNISNNNDEYYEELVNSLVENLARTNQCLQNIKNSYQKKL